MFILSNKKLKYIYYTYNCIIGSMPELVKGGRLKIYCYMLRGFESRCYHRTISSVG